MFDLLIENGTVFNPEDRSFDKNSICVKDGIFVSKEGDADCKRVIDASDCLVAPGFIDSHMHVFSGGGSFDLNTSADLMCIPNGVTTCVDGGSAGPLTFEAFLKGDIAYSATTIKALLHMSHNGIMPAGYDEDEDPKGFDRKKIKRLLKQYGDDAIVGLKIRQHQESAGKYGTLPLKATVSMAEEAEKEFGIKCSVTVHVTNLAENVDVEDILSLLRAGDVFTHTYQGLGKTIMNEKGSVRRAVLDAQKRGVIFDCGFATRHFNLKVMERAFEEGFYPNIIGTDLVGFNAYLKPLHSFPYVLSMLLALGMPLEKILEAATLTPAKVFHMEKERGSFQPGNKADAVIFKLMKKETLFKDLYGNEIKGDQLFVPMGTIKDGAAAFMQVYF